MEKIRLTESAEADLYRIYNNLESESPAYADFWQHEFFNKLKLLQNFPRMGRKVLEAGELDDFREIIIGRYRILYTLYDQEVTVVAIRPSLKPLN